MTTAMAAGLAEEISGYCLRRGCRYFGDFDAFFACRGRPRGFCREGGELLAVVFWPELLFQFATD